MASGKQITLSSDDKDFPEQQNFTLSVSSLRKYGDPDIQARRGRLRRRR
ncbi:hypothetical protein [Nocardioides convexus]|nr:hypothetical protein [Nocardioides convexus]